MQLNNVNTGCTLDGLANLDVYIWTEGFGTNLALWINYYIDSMLFDGKSKVPKIKGLIFGDPVISFAYQYNNFGSFALARGLIDNNRMQKISAFEVSFILQSPTNQNICNLHNELYTLLRSTCPYNVEHVDCIPQIKASTNSNEKITPCSIFPLTDLD